MRSHSWSLRSIGLHALRSHSQWLCSLRLCALHSHSESLCSFELHARNLDCFALSDFVLRTRVYYNGHFAPSGFALCTRIIGRFAPSSLALCAHILLALLTTFRALRSRKFLTKKSVSQSSRNALKRIEMQKKASPMGLLCRFASSGIMLAFLVASLPQASCFALAFSVASLPRASYVSLLHSQSLSSLELCARILLASLALTF